LWDVDRNTLISSVRNPLLSNHRYKSQNYPFMNDRLIKRLLLACPSFHHALDLQDADGRTALWFTCYIGNYKLTRLLLRAGADPTLASFPLEGSTSPVGGVIGPGTGPVDETAGTTPVEVLRRRRRARGFIRMVEVRVYVKGWIGDAIYRRHG
jgi:ankyrin repeat protein